MPLTTFSTATVTRLSTSSVERPGASVWISTRVGANSGKTSSGVVRTSRTPTIISTTAAARVATRSRNAVETIQASIN